jgi:hypothetical protein
VSKHKDSAYRSGRSPDWLKMKNSAVPAVKREGGRMGQKETTVTTTGKNRIMIYAPSLSPFAEPFNYPHFGFSPSATRFCEFLNRMNRL